jgi:hypothetical protein
MAIHRNTTINEERIPLNTSRKKFNREAIRSIHTNLNTHQNLNIYEKQAKGARRKVQGIRGQDLGERRKKQV